MAGTIDVPALLGELEIFASLKKADLKRLEEEKHCQLRRYAAGDAVVRQGGLDTEFYVVIDGIASAYRTDAEGHTRLLGSFVAGDWFGEMSAISHQPRSATVRADTPCTVVMIDVTMFQMLFSAKKSPFREMIDERYKAHALALHLETAPLFKGMAPGFLAQVAECAELVGFEKDETIAVQGQPADAVYLVRSGIVKRSCVEAGGEIRIEEYLCDNSSFGERSLTKEATWPSTYETMSQADVVRISRDAFERLFGRNDATVRTRIVRQAALLTEEEAGAVTELADAENIEHLVGRETIKGTEALVIDLKKCTRCNACVESCVAVHEDRVPRLSKRGIKVGPDLMLSSACYNCKIPECMLSCKYGAIRRDMDGQIHIIVDNCVGCAMCESHCPYGVIRMAHVLGPGESAEDEVSFLQQIPILNKIFGKRPTGGDLEEEPKNKDKAKAIKCDLCAGLPFEACVYNCPCGAISRKSPERLRGVGTIRM